jgi:hypothetical protein
VRAGQHVAQHALGQDEAVQVQRGEVALPLQAVFGGHREAVLHVERQAHLDGIDARVGQRREPNLRQHRVDIVDLEADLEADSWPLTEPNTKRTKFFCVPSPNIMPVSWPAATTPDFSRIQFFASMVATMRSVSPRVGCRCAARRGR